MTQAADGTITVTDAAFRHGCFEFRETGRSRIPGL